MSKEEFKVWLRKCGMKIKVGDNYQNIYLTEELVDGIANKAQELKP